MIFELEDGGQNSALMKVIGVGGAGGNAVNRMILADLEGVDFISANTDAQALEGSKSPTVIQLGKRLTRGLGAGARPEVGRQAIAEDADEVRQALQGADLVFVAAGMGGGTGTGAAPIIGEIAKELGALAIAIVTRPFSFEGKKRMRQAEQGLAELRRTVDTMIVVPNDRLLSVVGKGTSFRDALKKADEVLLNATQGISDLIRVSGDVNVDFADVRTIMSCRGPALMGSGVGRGENRAIDAAQEAVASPLLDNISIRGAKGVLINITGGMELAIDEVTEISTMIQEEAGDEAEIIFGAVHDPTLEGEVRVTLIATGFETNDERRERVIKPQFRTGQAERPEVQRQEAAGAGASHAPFTPFGGQPLDRVAQRPFAAETRVEARSEPPISSGGSTAPRTTPMSAQMSAPLSTQMSTPMSPPLSQVDPELELPTFITRTDAY